jgi:flagellin-specific chaperone FliS
MSNQWIDAITPEIVDVLFEDLLTEASNEEHVSILFNALQNFLDMAWGGGASGKPEMQSDGVLGAVAIICFLREHLRKDSPNLANGVLRRFYNAAHRQIITAHRDDAFEQFREIKASIGKVIQRPYSRGFFQHCMHETYIEKLELVRFLLSRDVRGGLFAVDQSIRILGNSPSEIS